MAILTGIDILAIQPTILYSLLKSEIYFGFLERIVYISFYVNQINEHQNKSSHCWFNYI